MSHWCGNFSWHYKTCWDIFFLLSQIFVFFLSPYLSTSLTTYSISVHSSHPWSFSPWFSLFAPLPNSKSFFLIKLQSSNSWKDKRINGWKEKIDVKQTKRKRKISADQRTKQQSPSLQLLFFIFLFPPTLEILEYKTSRFNQLWEVWNSKSNHREYSSLLSKFTRKRNSLSLSLYVSLNGPFLWVIHWDSIEVQFSTLMQTHGLSSKGWHRVV